MQILKNLEKRNMVLWLDHKAKKRSACEINLQSCNLWFPLRICSVGIVSLSYHEPPVSFWLLILWITLSWTPLTSSLYLNGSSHVSPLQFGLLIRIQDIYPSYIMIGFFLQVFWALKITDYLLHLADVIFKSFVLIIKVHPGAATMSPHTLGRHLQTADLHKPISDSLHRINAARHWSLCEMPHFQNHLTNQHFLKFGLNYMHWALCRVHPDSCWKCTLIKHREHGMLTILCSVKMYLCR